MSVEWHSYSKRESQWERASERRTTITTTESGNGHHLVKCLKLLSLYFEESDSFSRDRSVVVSTTVFRHILWLWKRGAWDFYSRVVDVKSSRQRWTSIRRVASVFFLFKVSNDSSSLVKSTWRRFVTKAKSLSKSRLSDNKNLCLSRLSSSDWCLKSSHTSLTDKMRAKTEETLYCELNNQRIDSARLHIFLLLHSLCSPWHAFDIWASGSHTAILSATKFSVDFK